MFTLTRRGLVLGAAAMAATPALAQQQSSWPAMVVTKDPNCGCCGGWIEHVRAAGFQAKVVELSDLGPLKSRLGVPGPLASCHTAEIGGYVIEGHVPASAIRRLLAERPAATGLAVPGMPIGSPGMEVPGAAEDRYEVIPFGPSGERVYARYQGARVL